MQTEVDRQVRFLAADGQISAEIFSVSPEVDRKGNLLLIQVGGTRKVRCHPSRALPVGTGGAAVTRGEGGFCADCPSCHEAVTVDIGASGTCPNCGQFELDWSGVEAGPLVLPAAEVNGRTPTVKPKKKFKPKIVRKPRLPATIDFALMRKKGELWTKVGVEFDYPDFDVRAHTFVITTGKPRKLCFNSYNGTWGKRQRTEELEAFLADKPLNGKPVGHYIKVPLEAARKKLAKDGYTKEG